MPEKHQLPERNPPTSFSSLCTSNSCCLAKGWGKIKKSSFSCDYFASAEWQVICFISHSKSATAFLFVLYKRQEKVKSVTWWANLRADVSLHSSLRELAAALMRMPKELQGNATHAVSYRALSQDFYLINIAYSCSFIKGYNFTERIHRSVYIG